jgi:lipopolysaccharide exporter
VLPMASRIGPLFKALRGAKGTLVSGAVLSQLIYMGLMPLTTRTFSPADFGVFSVWFSIVSFFGVLVNLRLETAILGEKTDDDAFATGALSLVLAPFVILIYALAVNFIDSGADHDHLLIVAGVFTLAAAAWHQLLRPMALRKHMYTPVAESSALQGFGRSVVPLLLAGALSGPLALAAGEFIGRAIAAGRTWRAMRLRRQHISANVLRQAYRRNAELIKFGMPSGMLDTLSFLLFIPACAKLFGLEQAGLIALALRFASAPYALLGTSFADVFHLQFAQACNAKHNPMPLLWRTVKQLAIVGLPMHAALAVLAPALFGILFGAGWESSGMLAVALLIGWTTTFVVSPLSRALLVTGSFRVKFLFDIGVLIVAYGTLFGTAQYGATISIFAYGVARCACDLVYFLTIRREIGRFTAS